MNKKLKLLSRRIQSIMFGLKVKFFDFLVSKNLVVYHNIHKTVYHDDKRNNPIIEDDITTSRYTLQISRLERVIECINEVWYENLNGKKLFVIDDSKTLTGEIDYRINLTHFVAHFSRKNKVHISKPRDGFVTHVRIVEEPTHFSPLSAPESPCNQVSEKTLDVDFLKYRFALSEKCDIVHFNDPEYHKDLLLFIRSKIVLMMDAKVFAINKDITGVEDPNTLVDRNGYYLAKPYLCPMCHFPVFEHKSGGVKDFRCVNHGLLRHPNYVGEYEYERILDKCYDELEYRNNRQF